MNEVQQMWQNQNNNFQVMYQALWDDVVKLSEEAKLSKSTIDCSRRSFVRTCFAFIEGVNTRSEALSSLGKVIRGDNDIPKKRLNNMLHAIIRQIPSNRYDHKYRDKRGLSDRVKDAFKAISAATGHPFDLSTQNKEWGNFNAAIKIRDRITHPYIAEDLRISDSELILVTNSTAWYHNMFSQIILGCPGTPNAK